MVSVKELMKYMIDPVADNIFDAVGSTLTTKGIVDRAPKTDDGSLSRLCAREGARYVNIEAGLGQEAKQKAMLAWVEQALRR